MANTKEGWVEEHMGGSKWAKSYIVLQSNFLLIFAKPPGGLHKPRTRLDVTSCYVLRKDDFRQNTFALTPKDKSKKAFYFAAPDRQTAEEWLDAIKTQQMPLPKLSSSAGGPHHNPYMPRKQTPEPAAPQERTIASSPSPTSASSSSPPSASLVSVTSPPSVSSPSSSSSFSSPAPQSMYPSPVASPSLYTSSSSSAFSPAPYSQSAPLESVPAVGVSYHPAGPMSGSGAPVPAYHSGPAPYVPPYSPSAVPLHHQHQYQQPQQFYQQQPPQQFYQQQPQYVQQPAMLAYGGLPAAGGYVAAPPPLGAYPQHHSSPALFATYGAPSSAAAAQISPLGALPGGSYYYAPSGPAYPSQAAPHT